MNEPLNAEQLAAALHAANGDGSPESDDRYFPYIDAEGADVIDGGLSALCQWLVARYDITSRLGGSETDDVEVVKSRNDAARSRPARAWYESRRRH